MAFSSSYARIISVLAEGADSNVIDGIVYIHNAISNTDHDGIQDKLTQCKAAVQGMRNVLDVAPPPPAEGEEVDQNALDERARLKDSLHVLEREIDEVSNAVSSLEGDFSDKCNQSMSMRRSRREQFNQMVEDIMSRVLGAANLSSETVKQIKPILTKTPKEQKAALQAISGAVDLETLVRPASEQIKPALDAYTRQKTELSKSDLTLFAQTKTEVGKLSSETTEVVRHINDIAAKLGTVSKDDPKMIKEVQAIQKQVPTTRSRTYAAPAA